MLIRPLRTVFFVAAAFVAGMFYERLNMDERCAARGGEPRGGLCVAVAQ